MPRLPTGTRRPRPKKEFGTAADPRNGQKVMRVDGMTKFPRFDPPETIKTDLCLDIWESFFEDNNAYLITPSSKHLLVRWIEAVQRYEECMREADLDRIQTGSTGQPVLNPLYKVAAEALQTIEKTEKQLGIGPLNATTLGLAAIQERLGLDEINNTINDEEEEDEDDGYDPRI